MCAYTQLPRDMVLRLSSHVAATHRRVLTSFLHALMIGMNAVFAHYFLDLRMRKCPCAMHDWRNDTLVVLFGALFCGHMLQLLGLLDTHGTAQQVMFVINVAATLIAVSYLQKLYEVDCQTCSESPVRTLLNMFVNFHAFLYALMAVVLVFESMVILELALARRR